MNSYLVLRFHHLWEAEQSSEPAITGLVPPSLQKQLDIIAEMVAKAAQQSGMQHFGKQFENISAIWKQEAADKAAADTAAPANEVPIEAGDDDAMGMDDVAKEHVQRLQAQIQQMQQQQQQAERTEAALKELVSAEQYEEARKRVASGDGGGLVASSGADAKKQRMDDGPAEGGASRGRPTEAAASASAAAGAGKRTDSRSRSREQQERAGQ